MIAFALWSLFFALVVVLAWRLGRRRGRSEEAGLYVSCDCHPGVRWPIATWGRVCPLTVLEEYTSVDARGCYENAVRALDVARPSRAHERQSPGAPDPS